MFNLRPGIFFDEETPAGANQEEKDVKVDDLTEDQIDDMGHEEIDRVQFDEEADDAILKAPEKKKEETPPAEKDDDPDKKPDESQKKEGDDDEKKPDEEDEKKKDEPTIDDEIAEIEKISKEERTDIQVVELRRLNAERRMHQATKEAADLRNERDGLKEEIYNKELEGEEEEPERLSDEEREELPAEEKEVYDKEIKEYDDRQVERAAGQASNTFTNIAAFYKALKGITDSVEDLIKREASEDGKQRLSNADFREFLKSEEFKKVDAEVTGYKKQYDGTYSADQMMKAHFTVNKDKILSDAQLSGREQALTDIGRANDSDASKLDKLPKSEGKTGLKKVSTLTDDEIDNMGEEDTKSYVEQMEREGMA